MQRRILGIVLCIILVAIALSTSEISLVRAQSPGTLAARTIGIANIRTGPDLTHPIVTQLRYHTQIILIARTPNSTWFQVQGYTNGWISRTRITIVGDPASLPT